jgi:hypothetical protein
MMFWAHVDLPRIDDLSLLAGLGATGVHHHQEPRDIMLQHRIRGRLARERCIAAGRDQQRQSHDRQPSRMSSRCHRPPSCPLGSVDGLAHCGPGRAIESSEFCG